ncbi:MAG: thioredoxin [Candidatus Aureabacteria bacterium]|nr:thioredoxin [Candidatus Auribacterota bacterium]
MADIIHVNSENFDDFVLNGTKPAVVDFSAEWCGPCRRLYPLLEEIAAEYKGRVTICHLDVDEAEDITLRYQITSLPSLLMFKDGEVVSRMAGLSSKQAITQVMESSLFP